MERAWGRTLLVAAAIGLGVALGAAGFVADAGTSPALAQDDDDDELEGIVEALPPFGVVGAWTVAGRTVVVTEATEIERDGRPLVVGAYVEVEGTPQSDGTFLADEIELKSRPGADDDDDGGSGSAPASDDDDDAGAGAAPEHDDDDDGGSGSAPASDDDDDDAGSAASPIQSDDDDD